MRLTAAELKTVGPLVADLLDALTALEAIQSPVRAIPGGLAVGRVGIAKPQGSQWVLDTAVDGILVVRDEDEDESW